MGVGLQPGLLLWELPLVAVGANPAQGSGQGSCLIEVGVIRQSGWWEVDPLAADAIQSALAKVLDGDGPLHWQAVDQLLVAAMDHPEGILLFA